MCAIIEDNLEDFSEHSVVVPFRIEVSESGDVNGSRAPFVNRCMPSQPSLEKAL